MYYKGYGRRRWFLLGAIQCNPKSLYDPHSRTVANRNEPTSICNFYTKAIAYGYSNVDPYSPYINKDGYVNTNTALYPRIDQVAYGYNQYQVW
jgi:hypothetical protein